MSKCLIAGLVLQLYSLFSPMALGAVHEQIGRNIDLTLTFKAENGADVTLSQYFRETQPVMIVPVDYLCVDHCQSHLKGILEAFSRMRLIPGTDFQVVVFSIDPTETTEHAVHIKKAAQRAYGRRFDESGWHFLTGDALSIERLATNLGYGYKIEPESREGGHMAVSVFADSSGKMIRYLYGPRYTPTGVKAALIESGQNVVGNTWERFIYSFSKFEPTENRYKVLPIKLLGWMLLPLLIIWGFVFTIREYLSKRR